MRTMDPTAVPPRKTPDEQVDALATAPAGDVSAPLVSLVMAAWKPRFDWLLAAVDSALDHQGCDVELVVVDDGSPESVESLLQERQDPRLRVVRVPHGGEPRARNAGTAAARGHFIRYIDADDVLAPGSTARLVALADRHRPVIAYGATQVCDEELRPLWTMTSNVAGEATSECLLGNFSVRVPSMLFPRSVVALAGEWDPGFRVSHDWDFVLRALEHAPVRGEGAVATLYRRHGSSATGDPLHGVDGAQRVVARYFERHPEQRGTALERRTHASLDAFGARVMLTHGRWRAGTRLLAGALLRNPTAMMREALRGLPSARERLQRRLARGR